VETSIGRRKALSAGIIIGMRRIQQVLRLNFMAPKIKEDIVKVRQPRNLRLADLRKIPLLQSDQFGKFYGYNWN
jgi:site-specific DNA recombinase